MVRFVVFSVIAATHAHSHSHANRVAIVTSQTNSIQNKLTQFAEGKLTSSNLPTKVELDGLKAEMEAAADALDVNKSLIQDTLDAAKAAVEWCNEQYEDYRDDETAGIAAAYQRVLEKVDAHHTCRGALAEVCYPTRDAACQLKEEYRVKVIEDLQTNIPCVADQCGDYASHSQGCDGCTGQANTWYDDHYDILTEKINTCSTWTADCAADDDDCDISQAEVETQWCLYGGEVGDAIDVLEDCYTLNLAAWAEAKTTAEDDEDTIKAMLAASIKIDCFVDVIDIIATAAGTTDVDLTLADNTAVLDKVGECLSLDPNTTSLDIDYVDPAPMLEPTLPDFDLDQTVADLFYNESGTQVYTDAGYVLEPPENCSNL